MRTIRVYCTLLLPLLPLLLAVDQSAAIAAPQGVVRDEPAVPGEGAAEPHVPTEALSGEAGADGARQGENSNGLTGRGGPKSPPDDKRPPLARPAQRSAPAAAKPGPPASESMTLAEAIAYARKNNLQLKAARQDVQSAEVGRKLGWALLGPHISFGVDFSFLGGQSAFGSMDSGSSGIDPSQVISMCDQAQDSAACLLWMQQNGEYTGLLLGQVFSGFGSIGNIFMADTVKLSLGFAWPILNWSSLVNVRRMKLAHRMSHASLGNTSQDVVTNVTLAFYGLLAAQEAVDIVKHTAKATEEHLRQAEALKAAGLGTQVDILRWQAKMADDSQKTLDAEQRVLASKISLNNLLGRRLDAPLHLVVPATVNAEEIPKPTRRTEPLRSHPQLQLTRLNVDMKDVDHRGARAAFLPSMTLSGGYNWQRFLPYEDVGANNRWLGSWAVMLSLQVPLFDSMTKVYDMQVKALAVSKARTEAHNAERFLRQQALTADLEVQSAFQKIAVARKQVKLAAEAHQSAENLYRVGEAKTTDLLDAQNGLVMARFNLLSAKYSYLMALAQRARALGELR